MIWPGEIIFNAGSMLNNAINAVIIHAVVIIGFEYSACSLATCAFRTKALGSILDQKPSSKQASAGTIVSQFKKERLPLNIRTNCNAIIIIPAICLPILGQKAKNGAISSATQLNHTPIFKTE